MRLIAHTSMSRLASGVLRTPCGSLLRSGQRSRSRRNPVDRGRSVVDGLEDRAGARARVDRVGRARRAAARPAGHAECRRAVDRRVAQRVARRVALDDSGLPPEVAAFLTATAVAAGVDPVTILHGAPARPRKRSRTSPDRVQRSFYLSRDLVDRARAAVSATMRRPGEAYNVSQLAGRALEKEVRRLEISYNNGQPFPPVTQVRSGPSPEGVERIRTGVTNPRRRRHA
jgi:hypothetical protein